jgi:hypothetical protein
MSKSRHTSVKIYEDELDLILFSLGHACVTKDLNRDDLKVITKLLDRLDRAGARL